MKLEFRNNAHATVEIDQARTTIGRDAGNAIVLDAPGVSGFHAELHNENGRLFVVDLGSANGTLVNGRRISGREEIKAWDVLKIDTIECEIVDPSGRRPTQARPAITDAMLGGSGDADNATRVRPALSAWSLVSEPEDKPIALGTKTTFGRDASCDVVLHSNEISRRHAEIVAEGGRLSVRDLGSANGTFVNGKRVSTETALKAGDEVRFDQLRFRVVGGAEGDTAKTAMRPAVSQATVTSQQSVAGRSGSGTQVMPALRVRLVGVSGAVAGRSFEVLPPGTIGRDPSNSIAIDDPTVSSRHARLVDSAGAWRIEDLGSTNGVFVNGGKIDSAPLRGGEKILVGKVELRFETGQKAQGGGTTVMPRVSAGPEEPTRTSVQPGRGGSGVPAWVYGLVGFLVVALVAGVVLFRDQLPFLGGTVIDAPLQAGRVWEQVLPDGRNAPATPVIADVNGDGVLDVIIADARGFVLALDGEEGKRIFDVDVADRILAPPVAGDLTRNREADVVVGTYGGNVLALDGRGQVLWRAANLELGSIVNRPVLHDVNGDGVPDVIVPTESQGLVALDGARGWKLWDTAEMFQAAVVSSPLAVDVNRDGITDFIGITDRGQLVAVSSQDGRVWQLWQVQVPAVLYASPAFARIDRGGVIIAATRSGLVAVQADSGRVAWQKSLPGEFFASPVVADLTGDRVPEVVVVGQNGQMHVLNASNGDEIWSANLGTAVRASPALFDFTGNGLPDVLILGADGSLRVLHGVRGREELRVRITGADEFVASPLLADMTGDGLLEVIVASQNGRISTHGFNRTVRRATAPWPVFLGNDQHALGR